MTHPKDATDEMRLPVNHEEAFLLAWNKRDESNLARCYLDYRSALVQAQAREAACVGVLEDLRDNAGFNGPDWVEERATQALSQLDARAAQIVEIIAAAERLTGCEIASISWANAYDALKAALIDSKPQENASERKCKCGAVLTTGQNECLTCYVSNSW